ncbi:MAG: hypothetical protein EOM62_07710 [Bacteroidia bacterium]|nr:hypothetical protein [Bacteroidia bacterium]
MSDRKFEKKVLNAIKKESIGFLVSSSVCFIILFIPIVISIVVSLKGNSFAFSINYKEYLSIALPFAGLSCAGYLRILIFCRKYEDQQQNNP